MDLQGELVEMANNSTYAKDWRHAHLNAKELLSIIEKDLRFPKPGDLTRPVPDVQLEKAREHFSKLASTAPNSVFAEYIAQAWAVVSHSVE